MNVQINKWQQERVMERKMYDWYNTTRIFCRLVPILNQEDGEFSAEPGKGGMIDINRTCHVHSI